MISNKFNKDIFKFKEKHFSQNFSLYKLSKITGNVVSKSRITSAEEYATKINL